MSTLIDHPRPLALDLAPARAFAAWPGTMRLAALWSSGDGPRARWTLLARPTGESWTLRAGEELRWPEFLTGAMGEAGALAGGCVDSPPFRSGWVGFLSYELGRVIEPCAAHGARRGARCEGQEEEASAGWPLMHWQRFEDGLAFDHEAERWWGIGAGAVELARSVAAAAAQTLTGDRTIGGFTLSPLRSSQGRERFERGVASAIEYIRAGDVYQVNLTHCLRGDFAGSSRDLFLAVAASASPWFGSYLELCDRAIPAAIVSASPELFLSYDPATRRVETRPMKGTGLLSPDPDEAAVARDQLERSEKDRAELSMIVDLMRNDLGRVCELRSIRVERAREMERHSSLLQTTATVSGALARGRSLADLLAATFPGGSITGAPKVRAMQIIEELEPTRRGPYCGGMGYVGDDGRLILSIAIRTAAIRERAARATDPVSVLGEFTDAVLDYGVGAGIVADSTPRGEWEETLAKAEVIGRVAGLKDE